MAIRLLQAIRIAGAVRAAGERLSLAQVWQEADLVSRRVAVWVDDDPSVAEDVTTGLTFSADWLCSLLPDRGPMPVVSVGGQAGKRSVIDCYGRYRELSTLEVGFWGARRVFNLLRSTESLDNANSRSDWALDGSATCVEITDDSTLYDSDGTYSVFRLTDGGSASSRLYQGVGVLAARRHTISCEMYAGTASTARLMLYINAGAVLIDKVVTLTAGWNRFCASGVPDGSSTYRFGIVVGTLAGTGEGTIYVKKPMVEDTSGLPVDVCSEYVSRDVLPDAPYHGTNQDGSKCFTTLQGNSVDANGLVTVGTGAAIDPTRLYGVAADEAATIDRVLNNRTLAGWTKVDATATITDANYESPRCDTTATKYQEGTGTAKQHGITYSMAGFSDNVDICASVWLLDPGGGNGRAWWDLYVTQKDLATQVRAPVNIQTGAISTAVTSGAFANVHRPVDQNGNPMGWVRIILRCNVGAHASNNPLIGIRPLTGDPASGGTASFDGADKFVYMWHPNAVLGIVAGTSRDTDGTAATKPGVGLEIPAYGVVGVNDFAVACDWTPFFDSVSTLTGANEGHIWALRTNTVDAFAIYERMGMRYRRRTDGRMTGGATFVLDQYAGDPYFRWVRRDSTYYPEGAWIIRSTTKPDNTTGTKWYQNRTPGGGTTGASQPVSWDNTFVSPPDNVTAITPDGTCRWQACADVEPAAGDYEPYNVNRTTLAYSYMQTLGTAAWIMTDTPMGFVINGQRSADEGINYPVQGNNGDLPRQPSRLCLGKAGVGYGAYHACMKNVRVWSGRVPEVGYFEVATRA